MKKTFFILAFILILLFTLAACDGNTSGGNGGNTGDTPGGDNTPHTHTFGEWITVKEATDTEDGKKVRICACGEQETETIPALGHTFGEWEVDEEPTCVKTGTKHHVCEVCGNSESETIPVDVTAHNYDTAWTSDDENHWHVCQNEGCTSVSGKTPHTFGEWIVDKLPTSNEDGSKHTKCTVCDEGLQEETIPAKGSAGLAYQKNADGKSCTITGKGTCLDTKIVIPTTINGCKVTAIASYAFDGCTFTSIKIPDSVTSINRGAFKECENLRSITVSNSITTISYEAFYGCTSLVSITIPDNVTSIDKYAFEGCTSLTSLTFSENSKLTSIGDSAFEGCTRLTSVTIPDSVTTIGNSTFAHCTRLTITIGENSQLTSIGWGAFSYCESLTSITIPDSVTRITVYTFAHCENLMSITIPDSITKIGDDAFYNCYSLTTINFNGTTTEWNNIAKGDDWNFNTPTITVTCTDGVYPTTY